MDLRQSHSATAKWISNHVYSAGQEERRKLDTLGSNSPPHPDNVQIAQPYGYGKWSNTRGMPEGKGGISKRFEFIDASFERQTQLTIAESISNRK